MIVKLQNSDWGTLKPFLDNANAHRTQFTGTGHTLSRDLDDPRHVIVVVRFGDLERAKAWVEATSDEDVLNDISKNASLTQRPDFGLSRTWSTRMTAPSAGAAYRWGSPACGLRRLDASTGPIAPSTKR